MVAPTFADYVQLLFTLFERFLQEQSTRHQRGHPFVYQHQALIVFFLLMQQVASFASKPCAAGCSNIPRTVST